MTYTNEQALERIKELRAKINVTPIESDDGADEGNATQNEAFSLSLHEALAIRENAAWIDVDGIDANALWREVAHGFHNISNDPLACIMFTQQYLDALEQAIKAKMN